MENPSSTAILHCRQDICWTVENDGLLLIDRAAGTVMRMGYPDAALWDLMSREIPLLKIIAMMSVITGKSAQDTEIWVAEANARWEHTTLLIRDDNHG